MGSERSPEFLNAGTTEAHFQQTGKEDSSRHLLNNFANIGDSSGEHIRKATAGMLSGPEAVAVSSFKIALETDLGVIDRPSKLPLQRLEKLGIMWPDESKEQFVENNLANNSALSLEDDKTSGPWDRGETLDFPLFRTLFTILQKPREPILLEEIRDFVRSLYRDLAFMSNFLQSFLARVKRCLLWEVETFW